MHQLFTLVDTEYSDTMQLGQLGNQNNQKRNDIYSEEGNVVMGIMSTQEETTKEMKSENKISLHPLTE